MVLGFQPGFPYLGSSRNDYTATGALKPRYWFRQVLSNGGQQAGVYPLATPVAGS